MTWEGRKKNLGGERGVAKNQAQNPQGVGSGVGGGGKTKTESTKGEKERVQRRGREIPTKVWEKWCINVTLIGGKSTYGGRFKVGEKTAGWSRVGRCWEGGGKKCEGVTKWGQMPEKKDKAKRRNQN